MRYPTVGALPLAQAARVETVLVKEELEWRRGGVQRARVEQWAGSCRRAVSTWVETRSRKHRLTGQEGLPRPL